MKKQTQQFLKENFPGLTYQKGNSPDKFFEEKFLSFWIIPFIESRFYWLPFVKKNVLKAQLTITCSKSIIMKALEQAVNYVQS